MMSQLLSSDWSGSEITLYYGVNKNYNSIAVIILSINMAPIPSRISVCNGSGILYYFERHVP